MKKITLTVKEFYLFKQIAEFAYDFSYAKNKVVIRANSMLLKDLGY